MQADSQYDVVNNDLRVLGDRCACKKSNKKNAAIILNRADKQQYAQNTNRSQFGETERVIQNAIVCVASFCVIL